MLTEDNDVPDVHSCPLPIVQSNGRVDNLWATVSEDARLLLRDSRGHAA